MSKTCLYTLGIPTYERPECVQRALSAARAQELDGIEIVVADNGASETVREMCHDCKDERVRYVAHERNIGARRNFLCLIELARGEYFSWLQDDDSIVSQFACRAVRRLRENPEAVAYFAYTFYAKSFEHVAGGTSSLSSIYGPPFSVDWCSDEPQVFDGCLLLPLALLTSAAIPPTIAFRRDAARRLLDGTDIGLFLLEERRWLVSVGQSGPFVVDPFVGGFYRQHERQGSRDIQHSGPTRYESELRVLAEWLDNLSLRRRIRWEKAFSEYLRSLPDELASRWSQLAANFNALGQVSSSVCRLLNQRIGNGVQVGPPATNQSKSSQAEAIKSCLRSCVPPILWRAGGSMLRGTRNQGSQLL